MVEFDKTYESCIIGMYRVFILIFFVTPTLNNKDNNYIKVMYYIKIKNTSMDHNR